MMTEVLLLSDIGEVVGRSDWQWQDTRETLSIT